MKLKELLDVFEVNERNSGGQLHIFEINANNDEYGKRYFIKHARECSAKLLNKKVVSINLCASGLKIDVIR